MVIPATPVFWHTIRPVLFVSCKISSELMPKYAINVATAITPSPAPHTSTTSIRSACLIIDSFLLQIIAPPPQTGGAEKTGLVTLMDMAWSKCGDEPDLNYPWGVLRTSIPSSDGIWGVLNRGGWESRERVTLQSAILSWVLNSTSWWIEVTGVGIRGGLSAREGTKLLVLVWC